MKKTIFFGLVLISAACLVFASCSGKATESDKKGEAEKNMYQSITQEKAKEIMDGGGDYVILDVREQSEFDEGHISGAILIPYTEIEERAENELSDKDETILVYCRSGRRSKIAAEKLSELGYTNVLEFGGIIDWEYGVVS